jgi:hypothetical protein
MSTLTEDERKALTGLSDVLQKFVSLRPNMPLHQIIVMIQVALEEGKSLKHYATATDYPTSTVSRTFLDCGPKMRTGEEGLGLLEARASMASLREYETHLTTKGRSLFKSVAHRLMRA